MPDPDLINQRRTATEAEMARFRRALNLLAGKWKLEILWHLSQSKLRFGELKRVLPGITQHVLAARLRELEADGMIHRKVFPEIPPRVEYSISRAAADLSPMFVAALEWAEKHNRCLDR